MLTRNEYLGIKRALIEELFTEFIEPERVKTIKLALDEISCYI